MINNVLNYIRQHPQLNEHQPHHYLQPPTQCQFCLESTNVRPSCDEQPAVMCILVSTQHLHSLDTSTLVQPSRLEKKNYTTVDPKQWVDSRSVLGNKVKDMKIAATGLINENICKKCHKPLCICLFCSASLALLQR